MTGSKLAWPLLVRMAAISWPDVRPWRSPKGKGRPWQASFPSTTLLSRLAGTAYGLEVVNFHRSPTYVADQGVQVATSKPV